MGRTRIGIELSERVTVRLPGEVVEWLKASSLESSVAGAVQELVMREFGNERQSKKTDAYSQLTGRRQSPRRDKTVKVVEERKVDVAVEAVLPEYPANGSRGPRFGGFMWYGQECAVLCTCTLCVEWRGKLGLARTIKLT